MTDPKAQLAFSLSLAATQVIRQVGERMERLDSLLSMISYVKADLEEELGALQDLTYEMSKYREEQHGRGDRSSGPDDVRVGGGARDCS